MRILLLPLLLAALPLTGQETAAPGGYDQRMDVVFGENHGVGLLMDIFTPKGPRNGLGIVDVASGAWHSDRGKIRDHAMAQVYSIFCGRGYTVFAVRPGSRSKFDLGEMDAHLKLGIRYVKAHASAHQIDPDRIGLTGASAGGHLAALAALTPEAGREGDRNPLMRHGTGVRAVAIFFPPTDFLDWGGRPVDLTRFQDLFASRAEARDAEALKELAKRYSPVTHAVRPGPPFLLIHGDADPVVPLQQSEKLVAALKQAGGSAELVVKPGGGHPWITIPEEVRKMADWFDRQLGREKTAAAAP